MSDVMRVTNHDRLGLLVKTWSTGKNRLGDGKDYPVPKDLEEFKAQLLAAGVGAELPARIKRLHIVQPDMETLVIRIPPKQLFEASEARFKEPGTSYRLPKFYGDVTAAGTGPEATEEQKLWFHASRIGDYTIANCV
ncbi:hypothetical protein [Muricoccus radiodurans]|uniref:hypothetical protein n=1 Tax=Muricoccus radiodurans TaxID=2231721 RepID=UPI003CF72FEA